MFLKNAYKERHKSTVRIRKVINKNKENLIGRKKPSIGSVKIFFILFIWFIFVFATGNCIVYFVKQFIIFTTFATHRSFYSSTSWNFDHYIGSIFDMGKSSLHSSHSKHGSLTFSMILYFWNRSLYPLQSYSRSKSMKHELYSLVLKRFIILKLVIVCITLLEQLLYSVHSSPRRNRFTPVSW